MAASARNGIVKAVTFFWQWSVPYKSSHRPDDKVYSDVWATSLDKQNILDILALSFPTVPRHELPTTEASIRRLVRERLPPPPPPPPPPDSSSQTKGTEKQDGPPCGSDLAVPQRGKQMAEVTEEAWTHLPPSLRHLLAAMNALHLENKLRIMSGDGFHPAAGRDSIKRSMCGINKTFAMWRKGYKAAISRRERCFVNFFFAFLAFSAIYPDVAAGFLGERSYNQRSIGMRIATLWQLCYLWTFPFHSCWLLFNWSLERLIGAFVGNTVYALAALVPAVHAAYLTSWFRVMMLVMSMCWQLGVQFYATARDYVMRLATRRQTSSLRRREDTDGIDWKAADESISNELLPLKSFIALHSDGERASYSWQEVPIRVRTERFIQFTTCFKLGRPADQLVGLVKDDLEGVINTYEDYLSTAPRSDDAKVDDGHVEPRLPKFLLVFFDIAIFAYVCYSFYPQPFTFNTVVAYGTVVTIKQTIVALKRYQTPKSARRLFTNMSAVNIIGVLLVSTPVTVDPNILADTGKFIGLTLAMTFATLFLAEPIAPLLLSLAEKMAACWNRLTSRAARPHVPQAPSTRSCDDGTDSDATETERWWDGMRRGRKNVSTQGPGQTC
ncbi:hypothetical protein EsDP_00007436 [Epichloe bromicola]|uniref:Uncharacterized protein n=1 Tax=Epichloe bromicola TaxID=79588 RepID=A0ABQ0D0W3_9HYPO